MRVSGLMTWATWVRLPGWRLGARPGGTGRGRNAGASAEAGRINGFSSGPAPALSPCADSWTNLYSDQSPRSGSAGLVASGLDAAHGRPSVAPRDVRSVFSFGRDPHP